VIGRIRCAYGVEGHSVEAMRRFGEVTNLASSRTLLDKPGHRG
jgi:hypothetical protein